MFLFRFLLLITFFNVATNFAQNTTAYKVVNGDTFYAIAKKNNISESVIYDLNPSIKGKVLKVDSVLNLPPINSNTKKTEEFHIVAQNDSYFSIAKKYKINVGDLKKNNPDVNPNRLQIGTKIKLNILKNTTANIYHIIKKGETLGSIAEDYDIGLSTLKRLNPKTKKLIHIGQKLLIKETAKPVEITSGTIETSKKNKEAKLFVEEFDDGIEELDDSGEIFHVIKKGETLNSISRNYSLTLDELRFLNPKQSSALAIGEKLLIKRSNTAIVEIQPAIVYEEIEENIDDTADLSVESLSKAALLIEKSEAYLGVKYRYGGMSKKGIDCSGLMIKLYDELEIELPRTSAEQSNLGKKIKKSKAQKGDLIFFSTNGKGSINHVGMITDVDDDDIKFIHASSSNGVVISSLYEKYYSKRFKKINRILQ